MWTAVRFALVMWVFYVTVRASLRYGLGRVNGVPARTAAVVAVHPRYWSWVWRRCRG
jgi:hypothetical protein